MSKPSLVIFDGNNVLNRGFHAVPTLTAPDGTPTNAIKGAINIMLKVLKDHRPTHVACVFDHRSKNFRHQLFADYKGQRERDPYKEQQLNPQKILMRQILKAMGLRVIHKRGLEADDVIGTIAKLATMHEMKTTIVSNDKDFAQLLDDYIRMLRVTGSGDNRVENMIHQANCVEHIGVPVDHVIEMLMLMGDKVDNIPGVPGVAEKTAIKLLREHGSIKGIRLVEDTLTPKLRENFAIARRQFKMTRNLVTIRTKIIEYDIDRLVIRSPKEKEFIKLCTKLGMDELCKHTLRTLKAL